MTESTALSLADLLAFYREAGVDETLDEVAQDLFASGVRETSQQLISPPAGEMPGRAKARSGPQPSPQQPARRLQESSPTPPPSGLPANSPPAGEIRQSPSAPPRIAIPDEAQAARARELARAASSLDELRAILADFDGCNLKFTAKSLVFADGNPKAPIMFVGEAPGREEDIEGLPFVGPSGQLLDRMLVAIGLDRTSAYIANVIPWRPPGNRTPTPLETEICRPFIERQIELVNPKILVTLGNPSTKLLLNPSEGIMRVRGRWMEYHSPSGQTVPAMPTLHPAYLLRQPAHKRFAWRDLLAIKVRLEASADR